MIFKNRFVNRRLLPVLAVMLLIFIHSSMPADLSRAESGWFEMLAAELLGKLHLPEIAPEQLSFLVRKAAHFTEYLLLGLSLRWYAASFGFAWLTGTVYAVTDELHQHFVPGRSCELRDVIIDAAGVMAGVLILTKIMKKRN